NDLPGQDIHGFAMSSENSDRLFAFVVGAGIFRSENAGRTWQRLGGQLPPDVMVLAVGGSPETIYAGSMRYGVLRSGDGGASWSKLAFPGANAYAVSASPARPGTILALAVQDGKGLVYRSEDGGATWGAGS